MSTKQKPEINVLIANHNYEDWVIDAIESGLNQTYDNISVTVVDDCSTDGSWAKIYDKYFKPNPHSNNDNVKTVKVTNKRGKQIELNAIRMPENGGPSKARNEGIKLKISSAFAFAILDADDMMKPTKVDILAIEMLTIPTFVGAVYADYDVHNITTGVKIREHKESFDLMKLFNRCIVHSGSLVSSAALQDAVDAHGYYDERIKGPEDWDLWLKIARKYTLVHVPESLTIVRATGRNISDPKNPEFSKNYQNGLAILREKHDVRTR